jgi:RNA polymerase sigma-70 factor (ECF subfamily)
VTAPSDVVWLAQAAPARVAEAREITEAADVSQAGWVVRAQRGDSTAFAILYERFHRVVHAIVLARVSLRDADDLVQDVFFEAWTKLPSLREPAAFGGWLATLARNRAIDHLRRSGPITAAGDLIAVEPPPRIEARAALQAIRDLPEAYRETSMMRLVEGLSGPEIAERTGITAESVRVNLHRGLKLLRERLEKGP